MTPEELATYRDLAQQRHDGFLALIEELPVAPIDTESDDLRSDSFAEAIFLRAFTTYESDIERLFFHYVTGGHTIQGARRTSYLNTDNESIARRITKGTNKFLSWAKPTQINEVSKNFLEQGWPIFDMISTQSKDLADCERVRNRIAHNSLESIHDFNIAQRNMLHTERPFHICPGQFLRIRNPRLKTTHLQYYLGVINKTLAAIIDPPAV